MLIFSDVDAIFVGVVDELLIVVIAANSGTVDAISEVVAAISVGVFGGSLNVVIAANSGTANSGTAEAMHEVVDAILSDSLTLGKVVMGMALRRSSLRSSSLAGVGTLGFKDGTPNSSPARTGACDGGSRPPLRRWSPVGRTGS
jgi:hypothetical protein